jgi:Cu(I)/Ag(I) efflux system membrane fusion protein
MNSKTLFAALAAVVTVGAGYALYNLGLNRGMQMNVATSTAMPAAPSGGVAQKPGDDSATGKKVLYWHDPMVPGQKFDKPGKSPFMDMQLVPVYADSGSDEGAVAISSRVQQNLGVRTAVVKQGVLTSMV